MKTNIKVIATSLSLATSVGAVAGMGGLSVQSHLGQPFSGSIVVSGDEARALIASGSVNVSGGLRASIIKQSEDRVVVRLRSTSPVREPVISFTVSAGRQTREYTAFIDPLRYTPKEAPTREEYNAQRGEQNMRQRQRTQQRDFIERRKPVVEQRRAASVVSSKTQNGEMAAVKKAAKVAVSPRRHRAQAGESLANIVERYRPRNMSQQTAMRALMLANPSAFKHGTTIRRNVTLYIPTESQWHAYAQRAQKQAMRERVKQVRQAKTTTMPVESPALPDVRQAESQSPIVIAKDVQPQVNDNNKNNQADSTVAATKPEVKASEPTQPSTPKKQVEVASAAVQSGSAVAKPMASVETKNASNVQPASGAVVSGSNVVAASQTSAVVPPVVKPVNKPNPVAPQPAVEETEEENDYLPLLLGGAGGALLLGGVGYALARRRKNSSDEEWGTEEISTTKAKQDDDDDVWDSDFSSSLTPVKNNAGGNAATVIDDEPYFDDFNLNKTEPAVSSKTIDTLKDEFSLDNFEADDFTTFDTASNNNKNHQDEDFSWTADEVVAPVKKEQQLEDDFVVAEDEDWSLDKLDSISNSSNSAKSEQIFSLDDFVEDEIQPVAKTSKNEVIVDTKFDDGFDLSDFNSSVTKQEDDFIVKDDDFVLFDTEKAQTETLSDIQPKSEIKDDLAFLGSLDDFVVPDESIEDKAVPAIVDDTFNDDFAVFDEVAPSFDATPNIESMSSAPKEDLTFGLDSFDDFVVEETANISPVSNNSQGDEVAAFNSEMSQFDIPSNLQTAEMSVKEEGILKLPSFDDFIKTETATESASFVAEMPTNDFASNDFAAFDIETPKTEAPVIAETQSALGNDLAFGLDAFEDFVLPETTEQPTASAPVVENSFVDEFAVFEEAKPEVSVNVQAASETEDLSFGLDAFDDFVLPDEPEKVVPAVADADNSFVDALNVEMPQIEALETNVPVVSENVKEDLAFSLDAFDDLTAPVSTSSENDIALGSSVTTTAQVDDFELGNLNLANDINDIVTPVVPETPVALDVPAVEEPSISFEAPAVNNALDDLAFDVDFSEPVVVEVSQPVGMLDLATGPLTQASSLDSVNLDSLEVIEDVQGWQESNTTNAGFVSGSVNDMTEPLEAKFELAKMYLEIDDAVAARETLRELISESSGEIQEQAKMLLADLGN